MTDVYRQLAQHLDSLPSGLHVSESTIEPRVLRQLFTPGEAELALYLTLIPEEPRVIARRAGIDRGEARRRLEEMANKGLIVGVRVQEDAVEHAADQYAIGVWRFHVNDSSPGYGKVPALPV
jgi:electron transport complex protein RnfB